MADEAFALSPINARAALPTDTDYDAICDAFMETSRGRWFLREYAKRNRNADTQMVLEAVTRIEENIALQKLEHAALQVDTTPPVDLMPAVQAAILEAREQIGSALAADDDGKPALDVIKSGMDTIRNVAWALRERGVDLQICGIFDHQVSLMMDGYLQLAAAQTRASDTPAQVLAVIEDLLQRVSDIAAGNVPSGDQSPIPHAPVVDPAVVDVAEVIEPEAIAAAEAAADTAAGPAIDADTAFREIYGDEHDIEILDSPVEDGHAEAASMDSSDDDDFIQAITDTAQELARLETLDTVIASRAAPADTLPPPVETMSFAETMVEAVTMAGSAHAMPEPPLDVAPVQATPAPTMPAATAATLPAASYDPPESASPAQPDPAAGTSLGHAVLRSGLVRPNGGRTDPLAVFNRMSQAEKIAYMT